MKRYVILLCFLTFLLGCTTPSVKILSQPQYPCVDEDVVFTYSTKNVDRVEVTDAQGKVLEKRTVEDPSGSFILNNINNSVIPLRARGWQGDEKEDATIPGMYPLTIIDGTTATEKFDLDNKHIVGFKDEQVSNIGCNCEYRGTEPITCASWHPLYARYETSEGQSEDIRGNLFSPRARVVSITNESDFRLTFYHNTNEIVELAPHESKPVAFTDNILPGGTWKALFESNDQHESFAGFYAAVDPKTPGCTEGWLSNFPRAHRKIKMKLSLRCNQ